MVKIKINNEESTISWEEFFYIFLRMAPSEGPIEVLDMA